MFSNVYEITYSWDYLHLQYQFWWHAKLYNLKLMLSPDWLMQYE